MMNKLYIFIIILITILNANYVEAEDSEAYFGPVTIIDKNEMPIDAMRRIYHEFIEIKKPVLKKIIYKSKGVMPRIEGTFHLRIHKLPSYYEYILTDEAKKFVGRHTGAEITATLLPLVMHPDYGGECAVIITAIATHYTFRNNTPSYHVSKLSSKISHYLQQSGYRSPTKPGKWDNSYASGFREHYSTGLISYYPRHAPTNSLHQKLIELKEVSRKYEPAWVWIPFIDSKSFNDWLLQNKLPEYPPNVKLHLSLIENFGNEFLVLGSYPHPSNDKKINPNFTYYILNIRECWPVTYRMGNMAQVITKFGDSRLRNVVSKQFKKYKNNYDLEFAKKIFKFAILAYEDPSAIHQEQKTTETHLRNDPDINNGIDDLRTLIKAGRTNDKKTIKRLLKRNFNLRRFYVFSNRRTGHASIQGLQINTVLYEAIVNHNNLLVDTLLASGADINRPTRLSGHMRGKKAPILWASAYDQQLLNKIINLGADINAQDLNGNTALHYFSSCYHCSDLTPIQNLLSAGADINALNKKGLTPLNMAINKKNNTRIQQFLESHGAKLRE